MSVGEVSEATVKAIADHGAAFAGANVMYLKGGTRDHFMRFISSEFPHMVEGFETLYAGAYAPDGYIAAIRAAQLGFNTACIDERKNKDGKPAPGGTCTNVGCIPSKALLHLARVLADAEDAREAGLGFSDPEIDLDGVRAFKDGAVKKLTDGLAGMAKTRNVEVVTGTARFTGPNMLDVDGDEIAFEHAIIAVGSQAVALPDLPDDPRIVDSTGALELPDVPDELGRR